MTDDLNYIVSWTEKGLSDNSILTLLCSREDLIESHVHSYCVNTNIDSDKYVYEMDMDKIDDLITFIRLKEGQYVIFGRDGFATESCYVVNSLSQKLVRMLKELHRYNFYSDGTRRYNFVTEHMSIVRWDGGCLKIKADQDMEIPEDDKELNKVIERRREIYQYISRVSINAEGPFLYNIVSDSHPEGDDEIGCMFLNRTRFDELSYRKIDFSLVNYNFGRMVIFNLPVYKNFPLKIRWKNPNYMGGHNSDMFFHIESLKRDEETKVCLRVECESLEIICPRQIIILIDDSYVVAMSMNNTNSTNFSVIGNFTYSGISNPSIKIYYGF